MQKKEDFFDRLKQLIRTPSVVGAEHPFFMTLKRELEELGVGVSYYEGMLVASGNEPNSGFLSAHCDRHGLVCTGPNEFQYAAFITQNRAEFNDDSISENLADKITDRFENQLVQAYEPWSGYYLGLGEIKDSFICEKRGNLVFEIAGLEHLQPHTPVAFMDKLQVAQGLLSAQLDNVLSVAVILHMYALGYQGTAFFTASEEAGRSWRFMLEWFVRYDLSTSDLLVLDTSPYSDLEAMGKQDITLRYGDAHARFDNKLRKKITEICRQKGVRYSYKDKFLEAQNKKRGTNRSIGRTELGRVVKNSGGKINGTTLQIPTTGYHTVNETARMRSVEATLQVLQSLYKL
ncbi:MAG: peptidase M42 [Campylobacterota bacterium]